MSDVPRKLWSLPMGRHRGYALAVLAYLWSYVTSSRRRAGGPHWVFHTLKRIAEGLDVGERQASQGLTGLAEAGLVKGEWHDGQYGYWLFTPSGLEDPQQAPDHAADDPAVGDRQGGDRRIADIEVGARQGDRRSSGREIADRGVDRSGRDRRSLSGGGTDRGEGDRRSNCGRSSIEFGGRKEEELATQLATQLKQAELASGESHSLRDQARELLAEAATVFAPRGPDGQLVVGPNNGQAVELLALLLDVPEQASRCQALNERKVWVRHVLLTYAVLCAADPAPGEGRWWTSVMFSQIPVGPGKPGQVRKPPWLVVTGKVTEHEAREAHRLAVERQAANEAEQARLREDARAEADKREAAARASWSPVRIAEALSGSTAPHAAAVRQHLAQETRQAELGLTRDEIIDRRRRLSELISVAQSAGEETRVRELSQARLELSRALHALDTLPFGAASAAN